MHWPAMDMTPRLHDDPCKMDTTVHRLATGDSERLGQEAGSEGLAVIPGCRSSPHQLVSSTDTAYSKMLSKLHCEEVTTRFCGLPSL